MGTARGRALAASVALAVAIVTSCLLFITSRSGAENAPATVATQGLTGVTATQLSDFRAGTPGTKITADTIVVGSLSRSYLVIAPASTATSLPMLVVLHGSGASVVSEAGRDELVALAQRDQAIVVYPSAYTADLTWNVDYEGCCQDAGAQGIPDASFIEQLVPILRADYHPSTLDLVGFSNGGKLAYDLMCQDSTLFNAVAVVSAVPLQTCTGPPIPILIALGSTDQREPLESAISTTPASVQLDTAMSAWRTRDQCDGTSSVYQVGVATQTTWTSCASASVVSRVLWQGVGHVWPRSNDVGANASAAVLVWKFFSSLK